MQEKFVHKEFPNKLYIKDISVCETCESEIRREGNCSHLKIDGLVMGEGGGTCPGLKNDGRGIVQV